MKTILTVNGTDMDGGPAGWASHGITDLELSWDLESPWSLSFSAYRICNSMPPFPAGSSIALDTTADDGSGRRHVFVGDLQRPQGQRCAEGYMWAYQATDLKTRASYISLCGLDGSSTASFNLPPDEFTTFWATNGLTVGQILTAVLQQVDNATALAAAGIGAYTTLSPPTLPAATVADLAALNVVPNNAVQLQGESILNTLEQFILHWHPQYCSWIEPATGTIRYKSIFALSPQAVALPEAGGSGADVDWPNLVVDLSECYTAWEIKGLDVQSATLSTVKGTLWGKGAGTAGTPASGWTATQESSWTLADFLQPKNASDDGALSGVTSTSATVTSDYARAHWPSGFWNDPKVGGWIWFDWLAGSGITIYETRQITTCTALTAGGTATVGWDTSLPLNSTGYNRYRIVGLSTPQSLVGRKFFVREPSTGKTGRDTWLGSHMMPRNSKGMPVANNSRIFNAFYPYAFVQWSRNGKDPWWEESINVQVNPLDGSIVLTEPAVMKSAALAGAISVLTQRYPTTIVDGLYYNVQVVLPYNRGDLSARAPITGYSGTAYTKYNLQRTFIHRMDAFGWAGDGAALALLANEHLKTVRDATISGTLAFTELPAFDAFTPGFCLNVSVAGASTPLDGLDLPVRAATIHWHDSPDPMLYSVSMRFNNRHRPFQGDSLYTHPALGGGTFGMQSDQVFGAEMMGMGQAMVARMVQEAQARNQGPTMESIAAQNAATMGGINAQEAQIGREMERQAHPEQAIAAANAPFARELQGQAMAARSGDPFGVMQGFRAGGTGGPPKPSTPAASAIHRKDIDAAAKARHDEREAAAKGRHDERETGQRQTARRGTEARKAPLRDAMEARKERARHSTQIHQAREGRGGDAPGLGKGREGSWGDEEFKAGRGREGGWGETMGSGHESSWGTPETMGQGKEGNWDVPMGQGREGSWGPGPYPVREGVASGQGQGGIWGTGQPQPSPPRRRRRGEP